MMWAYQLIFGLIVVKLIVVVQQQLLLGGVAKKVDDLRGQAVGARGVGGGFHAANLSASCWDAACSRALNQRRTT